MIPLRDTWLRVLLPLAPFCFFAFTSSGLATVNVVAMLVYPLAVVALTESSRWLIYFSHQHRVATKIRWPRVAWLLPAGIIMCACILLLAKALRNLLLMGKLGFDQPISGNVSFNNILLTADVFSAALVYGGLAFVFMLFVFEVAFHFAKLRYTEKQRDKLANEKLQLELQQLKGIVNPHFLFNNLNSLSSLITENPQQAEVFLDELTKVFRYLLRNNNTELITLREELVFIQSYTHLLHTRYGKSLNLHIGVQEEAAQNLLPPLTLQLLIENVVKHNKMNKSLPLQVTLVNEGPQALVLTNTLVAKEKAVESTGVGLNSINGRYALLQHKGLSIYQTENSFAVHIPLIAAEGSQRTWVPERKASMEQ